MTQTASAGPRSPWRGAAILAGLAIALAAVTLVVIRPAHNRAEDVAARTGLTSTSQTVMAAAKTQVLNLLTYTRKSFAADYARAVAGSTGSLKSDLTSGTKQATLLKEMTTGKFDLQGVVSDTAYEQNSGSTYLILVASSGYQLPDGGQRTLASTARFEVTMVDVGGKWLASDLVSVGLI